MSESVKEEMLRRAGHLARSQGLYDLIFDGAHYHVEHGKIAATVMEKDGRVSVYLKRPTGSYQLIYHEDYNTDPDGDDSIFKPERYQEALDELRGIQVLSDLADV